MVIFTYYQHIDNRGDIIYIVENFKKLEKKNTNGKIMRDL